MAVIRRSRRSARCLLLSLTTILGSGLAVPAFAQSTSPAPVRQSVDANGVDLFLGTVSVNGPALVAGDPRSPALTYYQLYRGSTFTDNVNARLYASGSSVTIYRSGQSDRFTVSGAVYTPTEGNGSTLSYNSSSGIYTYTIADGTIYHFKNLWGYNGSQAGVDDIVSPSGAKLTYQYNRHLRCKTPVIDDDPSNCTQFMATYVIGSITSTAGYKLTFAYSGGDDEFSEIGTLQGVSLTNTQAGGAVVATQQLDNETSPGYFQITDAAGRVTTYRMNGSLAGITLPGGSSEDVTYGYAGGRVTSVTAASGTTNYSVADAANVRTVVATDALSHATTYRFDIAAQRMTSTTDALNRTTSWQYDGSGRVTRVTRPEQDYTQYSYDARGNVTETRSVSKTPGTPPDIVTSASFPSSCSTGASCNQPTWTRDAKSNQTDYVYDGTTGLPTSVTAPAANAGGVRPQTRYGYTQLNGVTLLSTISVCRTVVSCSGGADETRTTLGYDPNLQTNSVSTAAGDGSLSATTTSARDGIGNVTAVDGPLPGSADTTSYAYDILRRPVRVVSADPDGAGPLRRRMARVTYDARGRGATRETGVSDADGANFTASQTLTTTYDTADRPVRETLSAGGTTYGVTQYGYDAVGRLQCTVQRMDPAQWTGQADACAVQTGGASGPDRLTRTDYDAAGQIVSRSVAFGTPAQSVEASSYTPNGRVAAVVDGESNRTEYVYDGFDRLSTTRHPSPTKGANASNGGDYEQLGYDANGNVVSRRLRDGQVLAYTYDALDRRTYDDNPNTTVAEVDVSYSYDLLGHVLNASDQHGWYAAFDYDALGRVTRQYSNVSSNTLAYDLAGRRTRETWADGFFVTYQYLVTGETDVIRENSGLALAGFGYDDLGRRTNVTFGNGTVSSYAYDPASRLSGLTQNLSGTAQDVSFDFTYNPAGQIAGRTASNDAYAFTQVYNADRGYTANGLNQYTLSGTIVPTYDTGGNLTAAGGQSYQYNTRNQLFQTGTPGQLFYHNPAGLLTNITTSNTVTNLDYVGADLATEFDGNTNGILRRYVYGPGTDQPLVWYEGAGTANRRYLHADERGSVIAVTNDAGTAIAINSYDEFGIPGSGNIGRFQYTGQKWIPELGMYDYKARMYSPTLGRFLQTDPIGYGDGLNWYNYVGGDPVNMVDPSGLGEICARSGGGVTTDSNNDPVVTLGPVKCHRTPDGGDSSSGRGSDGGFGPDIVVRAPRRTQTLSPCQKSFLAGQLSGRGLPTSQLGNIKFVSGLDKNSGDFTRNAFNGGAEAVTQGSTIYVQPKLFDRYANFQSANGYEEVVHTAQFAFQGSGAAFYLSYGLNSVMAKVAGLDGYYGNAYEAFAKGAANVMFKAAQSSGCRR